MHGKCILPIEFNENPMLIDQYQSRKLSVEKNKAGVLNVLEQDTHIVNNLDIFTLGKAEQFDYSILKYLTKNTDMNISIKNTMYPSYPGIKVINNL